MKSLKTFSAAALVDLFGVAYAFANLVKWLLGTSKPVYWYPPDQLSIWKGWTSIPVISRTCDVEIVSNRDFCRWLGFLFLIYEHTLVIYWSISFSILGQNTLPLISFYILSVHKGPMLMCNSLKIRFSDLDEWTICLTSNAKLEYWLLFRLAVLKCFVISFAQTTVVLDASWLLCSFLMFLLGVMRVSFSSFCNNSYSAEILDMSTNISNKT